MALLRSEKRVQKIEVSNGLTKIGFRNLKPAIFRTANCWQLHGTEGGTTTVSVLHFTGSSNSLSLSSDPHGGTLISFQWVFPAWVVDRKACDSKAIARR